MVGGSWYVARGTWLVVRGSWYVARGTWLVVRGSSSPKRKQRAVPFKTSALESARRAGIAGVFSDPPDLAANRKNT